MKIVKRNANTEIESISNGFILTFSGENSKEDWIDEKIFVANMEELSKLLEQWVNLPPRH
jgi:hypothetical protein